MNQAIVATAMFVQALTPVAQEVRTDPPDRKPAPLVQASLAGDDDKKPKPDDPKGKLSLVFSGAAYHFKQREYWDREHGGMRHFNEINPGIGVEYGLGKLGPFNTYVTAGIYKNSVYKTSKYLAAGIETDGSKFLGAGIEGGLLTGYPDMKVPIAAIPYVRVGEADGVNLKVNVIPPIKDLTPMTVGVQVRVPLGPK